APTAPGKAGPDPAQPATPGGPKSIVKIGSVGTLSGPVGGAATAMLAGLQVWIKSVNTAGGVNGHQIALVIGDDSGDPARHRSLLQKLVETDRVLAFVNNFDVLSASKASEDYLIAKRIPVIGGPGSNNEFYHSPMYFPEAAFGDTILFAGIAGMARVTVPEGKKKYGMLVCTEAQLCHDGERVYAESAPKVGVEMVYRGQGSLAQPDYTAQCLAARNAGVEVLLVILDPNSILRLGASCARQGYHPIIGMTAGEVSDSMRQDPNLDGAVTVSNIFPWFQTGTPATDEFQAALAKFGPQLEHGVGPATGWTSGKLFGKAAAAMPEPPTTEAILQGLWSVKNDTLGGLTQPLTFTEGRNAPPDPACWFAIRLKDHGWMSADNFHLNCVHWL
ncbi:MAG TPA: ABC transporter substrate-binding protein, partial [Acidimicrobiia bacterium]|nr:ABC transporter substrate-binding protein [Acidimicrobiia bacterium]